MTFDTAMVLNVLQLVWINILLSGDNAVVIALACNGLPARQKKVGIFLGAAVAVGLRVIFTFLVTYLLEISFLRIGGALLLFWIATKLLVEDEEAHSKKISSSERLLHAVRTVAAADLVMSLDNVLAIAAIAKENVVLLVVGLLISVPLIIAGSGLVMYALKRFPVLIWAGAALLGWVAGDMALDDPAWTALVDQDFLQQLRLPMAMAGAVLVVACGFAVIRLQSKSNAS